MGQKRIIMILVTGAAGFIGSALANVLNKNGYKTITIDDLSSGNRENIPRDTLFIHGNCADENVVSSLTKYPISTIIHLAGQSSGEVSFYDPISDQKSNTTSTILLLRYAKEKGIKKFIYASSMSVYGDHVRLPVHEEMATVPNSFYAVGKLASENYLRLFSSKNLLTTALRFFNVYGPGQNLSNLRQGMLSIYLAQALFERRILVKGDLNRFRDLIYIDDVVSAIIALLDNNWTRNNSVYNLSSGYPVKVSEMLDAIKAGMNEDIPVEVTNSTPGDQYGIYGSSYTFQKEFNWKPQTRHEEGIINMIKWALNSRNS
ncbi:MAG: NAD-dependent epimerase/dehydratase family protein [Bacteroidia bacterium]